MADNVLNPFKHQPLGRNEGSIRLLQVRKAYTSDGLIECELTQGGINTSSYICLSYVWGPPTPSQLILIDGRKLGVRQNLFDFLTHMCINTTESASELYWIDAVCIDQTNIPERNSQVAQMGDIYSRAQCVHLWPGTITGLDYFAHFCNTRGKELVERDGHTCKDDDHEREALQPLRDSVWTQIVQNQYWNRAWIVQELFLPQRLRVILGQEIVTFAELYMGLVYGFYGLQESNILQFRSLGKGVARMRGKSLLELVMDFHGKKCMVPRDRFYSLYSLCEERGRLRVDYEMPKRELVAHILNTSRKKECLCSTLLAFRTLLHDETTSPQQDHGWYLEFDCIGLDVWNTVITSVDSDDADARCESGEGYLSVIWMSDACQWGQMDMRRRFFIQSDHISRRMRKGKFPCYAPEVDHPSRAIPLSEETWEVPIYDPDLATERTEYISANGFSARLGLDHFTYTVRVAFWAMSAWIDGDERPDMNLTDGARDRGHGSRFPIKAPNLCARAETLKGEHVVYDSYEPGDYDMNELDVRVEFGHWDWDVVCRESL